MGYTTTETTFLRSHFFSPEDLILIGWRLIIITEDLHLKDSNPRRSSSVGDRRSTLGKKNGRENKVNTVVAAATKTMLICRASQIAIGQLKALMGKTPLYIKHLVNTRKALGESQAPLWGPIL